MITIDGSAGEGGGQVLRTALGLSLVTGQPFLIENIRAKRRKPGLMRQHLTALLAAKEIGNAQAEGAEIGSRRLSFVPGAVRAGKYHFSVGTAGSCTLVLQAVLPALLMTEGPSEIILEGGTHNPMAPPFDFLKHTFVPVVNSMGPSILVEMERPGFYPAGGGRIKVKVKPAKKMNPLTLLEISNISFSAQAFNAELPEHIARRELGVVKSKLNLSDDAVSVVATDKFGPGNTVSVFVHSDQLTETFTGFAQRNVPAEKVAGRAVREVRDYLESKAPVGVHLADQLLIPLALAGAGKFRTGRPTSHTMTNIDVIRLFLDIDISVLQVEASTWEVRLQG